MAAVAVVIGLPVGVVLGWTLWRLFAERLGVVPDPSLPFRALAITTGVAMLVGLLGALGPAISAARCHQHSACVPSECLAPPLR